MTDDVNSKLVALQAISWGGGRAALSFMSLLSPASILLSWHDVPLLDLLLLLLLLFDLLYLPLLDLLLLLDLHDVSYGRGTVALAEE